MCFEQHKRACDCQGLYERRRWTDVQLLTPPADAQPNSAKRKREEAELNSEQHKTAKKKRGRPRKHALPEGSGSKPGTADAQLLTPPAMPAEPEPAEEAGSSDPAERAHDIAEFSESWRDSSSHESHEVPLGCIRGPGSCIVRQCVGSACDEIVWQKLNSRKRQKAPPEAPSSEPEPAEEAGSSDPGEKAKLNSRKRQKAPSKPPEALPKTEVPEARRQKRLYENERNKRVREAGGQELYREQMEKAKTEVPEARRQKRLRENERNKRVREAGGLELYREQQNKAKTIKQLYRQQQRDRSRRKDMARGRKTRTVLRDEGKPAAQLLATQVVILLRKPGMFDRCLASLKKSKRGKVWCAVLRCAKLLQSRKIFYVDIEGHITIGVWEVAIVTEKAR